MCDISKKTELKTVTVYKVVIVNDGEYLSCFSHKKLKVGKVEPLTLKEASNSMMAKEYLRGIGPFYNLNMVGKVSGFALEKDALNLNYGRLNGVILKIVLGGEIMEGTTRGISNTIPDDDITYAGTEILSMVRV